MVRRGWEAHEGGGLSRVIALLGPDMVTYVVRPFPVAGTCGGPEGSSS